MDRTDIVILGAGLAGVGVALELSRRAIPVTLIEQDPLPINRASLRNEGKIHLGLIYANDTSLETAFMQLHGALTFRRILSRWIDPGWLELSAPFHYLVANDSILTAERLADHYTAVEERYRELLRGDADLDYLGERPARLTRPLSGAEIARHFDARRVPAGFATAERAINTDRLAIGLRRAVAESPNITFLPSHTARTLTEVPSGLRIDGDGAHGAWRIEARQVLNATWERRCAFDRQLGIPAPEHLLHRLKFRAVVQLPAKLRNAPSVSMVLGRYGDVVVRADGTAYLSWYPASLRGWSQAVEPPPDWDIACRGEIEPALAREIGAAIVAGTGGWYFGIERSKPLIVDAGTIVAIGTSDVDDRASGLHRRSRIGVTSRGGYHSLDSGKLTMAPLFALEAADRIEALRSAPAVHAKR